MKKFVLILLALSLQSCHPFKQGVYYVSMQTCSDDSRSIALKECKEWEQKLIDRHGKKLLASACNVYEGGFLAPCEFRVTGTAQIQMQECVESSPSK